MKKLAVLFSVILLGIGCKDNNSYSKIEKKETTEQVATNNLHEVTVKETLEAGGYTYLNVTEGDKEYWIAVPPTEIEVGKTYYYQSGMDMKNFESKALERTFESIKFVDVIRSSKEDFTKPEVKNPHQKAEKPEYSVADYKLEKGEGELTLQELFSNKDKYANKEVAIKGIVVKVNKQILDRNWIHVVDGTKTDTKSSLAITTQEMAKVGDTVTFKGKLILDKDFGYNYVYDLLLENAISK
ncbi:MAG TPA: hypothetical protein VJ970_07440 [Flavobacteriaceae bacterium]|nr:hypothetical protein [Flavobacteriaceae bacterium]